MSNKKILVLGTGGTIAGRSALAGDNIGYRAAEVGVDDLLQGLNLPSSALIGHVLEAVQVAQIDSKDMGPAVWQSLLLALNAARADPDVGAIVITHGTDTIEETAFLLSCLLPSDKPIVLTCAMRPATALTPDGPQNLRDAISVAVDPLATGVIVVAAGQVHQAEHVMKVHSYRTDAFHSGDEGPCGCVEEGRVRWYHPLPRNESIALSEDAQQIATRVILSGAAWPRVEIVLSHAGVSGDGVDALMTQANGPRPVQGLVVACTGNGTIHHELQAALERASQAGVVVWRSTRCLFGRIICAEGSPDSADPSTWRAVSFSPVKARLALTLTLMSDSLAR